MKHSVIHSAYSDYTPQTIPKTVLLGLLAILLCPKVGNNSEKPNIKY